jgi:cell division protein FtsW (lipid II flippase)
MPQRVKTQGQTPMIRYFEGRQILVRLVLAGSALTLVTIGILTIYAAGNPAETAEGVHLNVPAGLWKKQVFFAILGLFAATTLNLFDYRWLGPLSYWIYGAVLVLLAVLLIDKVIDLPFVPVINGSRRWIRFGFGSSYIPLQPSELCKIAYILALAWYLRFRHNYRKFKGLIGPFSLTLLAMVLILLEPDLGTVLLMMPILFAMLFAAGAKIKHLLIIILLAIMVSPLLWMKMHGYQRMRVSSLLLQNKWIYEKAENSPRLAKILAGSRQNLKYWERNHGFHIIHSKRAIASGGLYGYGFRQGPYLTYNSLPERQNDFIFAIIGHQFGMVGCTAVVLLYILMIVCGMELAWLNTEPFGRLVAVGILAMISVQVVVNVSMTMGLMPITGLTLPLISYGGSSLVVMLMAIGLLNNIGRQRPFSIGTSPFEHRKST